RLSLHSIPMLERFEAELDQAIGLRQCGYLFVLTREADVQAFRRNVAMQRRLGVATQWLEADEVRSRLPLLRLDDVQGGTFHARDGLCDPSSVVNGYVGAARRLGTTCLTDVEVTGMEVRQDRVTRVLTACGAV